jgi:Spy/CpxP family protein refolding chaperone
VAGTGLLAFSTPAMTQQPGTPPASAADSGRQTFDPVGRILAQRNELKLTDEQASRLEAIRTKYLEKHRGQIEQLRRDREARAAFRASLDSTRTEVMAVLTPEQQKQVAEMRKEWRRKWREDKHGGRHRRHHERDNDDT